MNIDKTMCKLIREDLNAALKPVLEKYDLNGHVGNITFLPGVQLSTRLVLHQNTPNAVEELNPVMPAIQLQVIAVKGDLIRFRNAIYEYVGRSSRGRKYTHSVRKLGTDKLYRMSDSMVQSGLMPKAKV